MPKVKSEWKLQFDPDVWDVVLPPEEISRVCRTIAGGPNAQSIEHCHFADTIEHLYERAPMFYMRVPICNKGESRTWPTRDVGQHLKIGLPIAIVSSERKDDSVFNFIGKIRVTSDGRIVRWLYVEIKIYDVSCREGNIRMPRSHYLEIVELWQRHFFETT